MLVGRIEALPRKQSRMCVEGGHTIPVVGDPPNGPPGFEGLDFKEKQKKRVV
jgi:hypothetical protein